MRKHLLNKLIESHHTEKPITSAEFSEKSRLRIAEIVEQTLADAYPKAVPFTLCLQRASTTHLLLNVLSDSQEWSMQAGGLMAPVANDDDYCVGWDFEAGVAAGHGTDEFHVWTINKQTGVIVDSTTRDFPDMARAMGRQWQRQVLPVAWDVPTGLGSGGYHYTPSKAANSMLASFTNPLDQESQTLAKIAFLRLAGASVYISPRSGR